MVLERPVLLAEMSERVGGLDQKAARWADRMDVGFIKDASNEHDGASTSIGAAAPSITDEGGCGTRESRTRWLSRAGR
jgi:hypothetical protein